MNPMEGRLPFRGFETWYEEKVRRNDTALWDAVKQLSAKVLAPAVASVGT